MQLSRTPKGRRLRIAVDLSAEKPALARNLGATATFASDEATVAAVRALTGGGCDHVFEMTSSVRALGSAVAMTRRGGTTVTAGRPPGPCSAPRRCRSE